MSSYREQFFEWVNKQPVYQDMTLQIKEMTLNLVDCWLNNNQAYFHYARLNGKDFAKRCAIDFCWFIKNQTIADLQHRLDVTEKALELACKKLEDYYCLDCCATTKSSCEERCEKALNRYIPRKFKEQAERELKF